MPIRITLVLVETPTFYLFDLPSVTVDRDSEEGAAVQECNTKYEYMTVGKGRRRRVFETEVQTVPVLLKSRHTFADRVGHKHSQTFASLWDMYDTYNEDNKLVKEQLPVVEDTETEGDIHAEERMSSGDKQMIKLMKNVKFLEALCVMERLLANNNFNELQKRFRGLSDPHPLREGIEYNYGLKLLWTFANEKTRGRCVSAFCWNPMNHDILAVGYGKFYFTDRARGMVMLWNIKNPVQPERTYDFVHPVTAISFSKQHPNLLAVGLYNGTVTVLDISERERHVIGRSHRSNSPSFEPIWHIEWFTGDHYQETEEQILTSCQDGRICKFRIVASQKMDCEQMMRATRVINKVKGIEQVRQCVNAGVPISRFTAAIVMALHPVDPNIYFVGTSCGTISRCSRNYVNRHLEMFQAHLGTVTQMKFSPFCNKLLLTCGEDWTIRIWADGIIESILELSKAMQTVQGADWCPSLSTLIASICGPDIYLWDIQRKTDLPQSITHSPTNSQNTVIEFTDDGRCLVIGDIDGNVHIFVLEDMPLPPFFQADLLKHSLEKSLVTRPNSLKELKKLGSLRFENQMFKKHFF